MKRELLTTDELKLLPIQLPEWEIRGKKIVRELIFDNFVEAFGLITRVALVSESINHHPDLRNVYNKVTIELTTHDLGGISHLDINLAESINKLI